MKIVIHFVALAILMLAGCSEDDASITSNLHEDIDHDHKHQHTDDDDHEHEHDDNFKGSHSHGHSHSHRHGDPLHGGRIVSIGHTHHKAGVTHFHAEIMPLADNTIRFYLLNESDEGVSAEYPVSDKTITAIVSVKDSDLSGGESSFTAVGEGDTAAQFSLVIPDELADGDSFSVVIPKVKLDGHRQNFSFSVSRADTAEEVTETPATQDSDDE